MDVLGSSTTRQSSKVKQPDLNIKPFYVTINPDPAVRINGVRYDCLKTRAQLSALHLAITKSRLWHGINKGTTIYYEFTKRSLIHAHFTMYFKDDEEYNDFRSRLASRITTGRYSPDIAINMCPSYKWKSKDISKYKTWDDYCNKNPFQIKEIKCPCFPCAIERDDKRAIKKRDHGEIEFDDGRAEVCDEQDGAPDYNNLLTDYELVLRE